MKVRKKSLYGMFGGFPSISDMYNNKCFCCPADRPGNRCCGEKWCAETWKRYEAIIKPEWHHVTLTTLTNIDFDMLDEKRQLYLTLYRDWKATCKNLRKCKCDDSYEDCRISFTRRSYKAFHDGRISKELLNFFDRKISMTNVECGVWSSAVEVAMGQHTSRKYNMPTLRY